MTKRQKSYAKVGDICRDEPALPEGEKKKPRPFGDMTDECRDAETVLRNWAEVAKFNVGTSAALAIMDRIREDLTT